jgi:hypothetical protein
MMEISPLSEAAFSFFITGHFEAKKIGVLCLSYAKVISINVLDVRVDLGFLFLLLFDLLEFAFSFLVFGVVVFTNLGLL